MGKKIHLRIPEPCHENWEAMTSSEQGRFCNACQKQVVDFEGMSDAQLIGFFRKRTSESVCGRFMEDQLNRDIQLPRKTMPWIRYFFQVAIPAFLFSAKVQAQGKVKVEVEEYSPSLSKKTGKRGDVQIVSFVEKGYKLTGKLVDDLGNIIPYASVIVKGTNFGAAADSNGVFSLNYSCKETYIRLLASCVGFEEKEIVVLYDQQETPVQIKLKMRSESEVIVTVYGRTMGKLMMMGGLAMQQTSVSIVDTIMNKILPSDNTLKLYPNPAKANGSISLSFEKPLEGVYYCQLLTLSGQFIFNRELWIDVDARVADIAIPAVRPGVYLIKLINKNSKKSKSQKIIIE